MCFEKMGIIFGKKKSRVTEQDKAVLQLKQQRDKLKQYQKRIELQLETDRELAKKLLNLGQRERAKLMLKKKKFQEQLLKQTFDKMDTLEHLVHDIEYAVVQTQVVEGLKHGNEALKKINEALSIVDVEKIMEETREGIEIQNEISAMISGLTEEDNQDVEDELSELIASELPNVPDEEPEVVEEPDEEKEPSPVKEKTKTKRRQMEKIAVEA